MSSGIALAVAICIVAGLFLIGVVVIFELRKTPHQEAEMIEREDEAMSKVSDDPHELARWVP
jgi:uncharacterized membrane protein YjfL (UPF0719 family)